MRSVAFTDIAPIALALRGTATKFHDCTTPQILTIHRKFANLSAPGESCLIVILRTSTRT